MPKLDGGDGRQITQIITVKIWSDGALSVEGPVNDPDWCEAALLNAVDAVRNQRTRLAAQRLIVPGYDVSVPDPQHPLSESQS